MLAVALIVFLVMLFIFVAGMVGQSGGWEWIPEKYRLSYRKFKDGIYDWLTKKDWTWRRIVHWIKFWLFILILTIVMICVLILVVIYPQVILASILGIIKRGVSLLTQFGTYLGFDGSTFALYTTAQVAADIIVVLLGLAVYVFFLLVSLGKVKLRGQPKPPKSNIVIRAVLQPRIDAGIRRFAVMISNNGDESAVDCKAFMDFDHITARDFVPNLRAQYDAESFRQTSFFKTEQMRIRLPWSDGPTHTFQSGELPERLEVMGIVPDSIIAPSYFAIQTVESCGANLTPAHYYGTIVVTQQHGYPLYAYFKTRKSDNGEWELELNPTYP